MDATLVPIIQGVITVAGTLGGAWLGVQLSKGKEDRQWRRDRCLDTYAEVLTLSSQLIHLLEDPTGKTTCDPDKAKLIWAKVGELHLASKRAALLAPSEVEKRIDALVQWDHRLADGSARPQYFNGVWVKMVTHHSKLAEDVTAAGRMHLTSVARQKKWWNA
jgi:uncharacterized membrane protein